MELLDKLNILADAAKYDAACTSSGVVRGGKPGTIGTAANSGCCHTFSADGRCVSLLKVLYTNYCCYDCAYCVNRRSNDVPRAAFTPEELSALGVPALAVRADVAEEGQVVRMVDNVLEKFCQLDILLCAAGVSHLGLISQIDGDQWRRLFAVNVDGVHHCCRAVLPHMLERKSGSIVTVSSMWGQVGASCEAAYSATKGAVIAYTKALAKELGPSGVRVNCVAPGVIETAMNSRLNPTELAGLREETPLGCIGQPQDVAETVAWLASDAARFITGQVISPNGGFTIY